MEQELTNIPTQIELELASTRKLIDQHGVRPNNYDWRYSQFVFWAHGDGGSQPSNGQPCAPWATVSTEALYGGTTERELTICIIAAGTTT
jgi:hypothetical protein